MRLILIRHGQTPSNVLGKLDTAHPGPGLTELGLQQATDVADALADQPVDALFTSTLVRTHLTAAPLAAARALQPEMLGGIHEIEAGSLEMRSDHDAVRSYMETVFAWGSGARDATMPGGYDGHEFFGRYDTDLAAVAASGAGTAAVVSHGAAIRVWVAANATNVAPIFAAENPLDNTGVVVLNGSFESGWTLDSWAGQPIGGHADAAAEDPTGETLSEARQPE